MNLSYKKIISIVIMIVIMLSSSCKKYEEDDYWITFRKPLKRILGKYHLKELILNSINYTDSIAELWGTNTNFEFSDIHYYYLTHDKPELNKGNKSLLVNIDIEFLNNNINFPPVYRGVYSIQSKKTLYITLPNPHDLELLSDNEIPLVSSNSYPNPLKNGNYPRSIYAYLNIIKIDNSGLIFSSGDAFKIVFERIN